MIRQAEKKKRETISVEEFISRLIRHIPDEQFKTIRHYGMYSRRCKGLSKKSYVNGNRKRNAG
ncbi:transposase [Bacillus carboniphilus]|uniref:Transposase n=1 Tax=Bacillus carboniphilus TaxID=86663 RepID=A0ABY9JSR2_9BACI|nr:transposase [Bacillus carboniphilus]WLR42431.1 transposase [Bacillus carboniphilus]